MRQHGKEDLEAIMIRVDLLIRWRASFLKDACSTRAIS